VRPVVEPEDGGRILQLLVERIVIAVGVVVEREQEERAVGEQLVVGQLPRADAHALGACAQGRVGRLLVVGRPTIAKHFASVRPARSPWRCSRKSRYSSSSPRIAAFTSGRRNCSMRSGIGRCATARYDGRAENG
jgi:hypothetical protein